MEAQAKDLAAALSRDDVAALSSAIQCGGLALDSFYAWPDKHGALQQRDLLGMAASAGAASCVAALIAAGANCNAQSPSDGNAALHCACSSASSSTARIIALLVRAGADKLLPNQAGQSACDLLTQETASAQVPCADAAAGAEGDSDLLRPEYSTDEFRMFSFKIDCCPRLTESHDWTLCPFQHPGEKARRRDPRCFKYQGMPCPDFRKGTCKRGDACTYAHGVFECWLHPSRYRTQLCKEGAACRRSVCFFAHSVVQLREPTMTEAPDTESPRGPLVSAEESQGTPRSWSPTPSSTDSGSSSGRDASCHALPRPLSQRLLTPPAPLACGLPAACLDAGSAGSLSSLSLSSGSSLSSTPMLEGQLCGSLPSADSLQRTLSSLSLGSDDVSQVAALQHMTSNAALLAASAAASWPVQSPHADALALMAGSPLAAAAGLPGMLLPDAMAVQAAVQAQAAAQAAAVQRQLAMFQAADPSGVLAAAAAGVRHPLLPLSSNLLHTYRAPHPPATPSCFSLSL